jgi:hypothetical protein
VLLALAVAAPPAVLVDNTNASAVNKPGCGVHGAVPCSTVSFGVAQALALIVDGAVVTVHVQGGGVPYLGECSKSNTDDGRGIVIPTSASLAVMGLNASSDGRVRRAAPVIDCEHKGRAFTYGDYGVVREGAAPGLAAISAPAADGDATAGTLVGVDLGAPQLTLEGLVVQNGNTAAKYGGGAVCASGAMVLRRCAFAGCFTGYAGGAVFVHGAALLVEDSNFTECESGGSGGGGVAAFFPKNFAARNITMRACNFVDTTSGGGYGGGAVYVKGGQASVTGVAVVLRACSFVNTTSGSSNGGGAAVSIYFDHYARATKFTIALQTCSFVNTTSSDSKGGGAIFVYFNSAVTDVVIALQTCSFVNTKSSGSHGGGAVLFWFRSSATDVTTSIGNSSFTGCSATAGDGGAVAVTHTAIATSSTTAITGSSFSGDSARGCGGALALSAPAGSTGVSLLVDRSNFSNNAAYGPGGSGGALSVMLPEEALQNLGFVGNSAENPGFVTDPDNPCANCSSFPDCGGCPRFNLSPPPVIAREHEFRHWDYAAANNAFVLRDSRFTGSIAALSGGALAAPGGGTGRIERCIIEGNSAIALFGGGASLGGTVMISVSSSRFARNECGQGGRQIYSSSGAGISFTRGSAVELGCARSGGGGDGTCITGLLAVQSGNWTWDASSSMSCSPGFELVNSSKPAYNARLDSWQIKAPVTIPRTCMRNRTSGVWDPCPIADSASNCPCYFSDPARPTQGFGAAAIVSPEMLVSALSYRCSPCAAGLYSLATPTLSGPTTVNATCTPCPYGGNCGGGGAVAAVAGFWGTSSGAVGAAPLLVFTRCPSGYCFDCVATTPCASISACAGNRDGMLCGGCAPGFAQTIGSAACRTVADCGGDAAWFVPGALLLAALYARYALHAPAGSGTSGWPLNAVQPSIYYYQVVQLLPVGTIMEGGGAHAVLALLSGFFNMQLHVSGGGGFACPFAALTTLQAIELRYAVPALVVLALALDCCVEAWKQQLPQHDSKTRDDSDGGSAGGVRWRHGGALVKVAALSFSALLSTTFQLLHCVDVGGARVLFRAGTVECGAWQAPLYALAFALLLPVAAALAAAAGVGAACTSRLPALAEPLSAVLRAPYHEGCGHWEAVLALHRLCVVAVHSFGGGAVAAVLQTLICFIALMVHKTYHPFREDSANRAQTALLSCIVVVALLNVPQATIDTNALAESAEMTRLIGQLQDGEAVLLFAPAALVGAALLALAWRRRRSLAAAAWVGCAVVAGKCAAAAEEEVPPLAEPLLPVAHDD